MYSIVMMGVSSIIKSLNRIQSALSGTVSLYMCVGSQVAPATKLIERQPVSLTGEETEL